MARDEENPTYYHAVDVLPFELAEALFAHLGTAQKVTFAPSHLPYNYSESQLPAKLVDKCREALDNKGIEKRRVVFVSALRAERWDPSVGKALIERGWPTSIVAIVIGYHTITLRRWGWADLARKVKGTVKPKVLKTPEVLGLGFSRLQKIFPGKEVSQQVYYRVGSAMLDASTPEVAARAAKIRQEDAKAAAKAKINRFS